MKIEHESIKRLLSDVSKETIKARTPEYKIAVYEYLRSKGVPEHMAVKKAAGVRYDKFMKLYEARKPLQKLKRILKLEKKVPLVKRYVPRIVKAKRLRALVRGRAERTPKDIWFESSKHDTSQKRYSWLVRTKSYIEKTGEDEERFVTVSSNAPLSDIEVKQRAVEVILSSVTSPILDIYEVEIMRRTIDRRYKKE